MRRRRRRPGSPRRAPSRRCPGPGRRPGSPAPRRAIAAARASAARMPVPPGCGPPAVSRKSRSTPAARYARARRSISPRPTRARAGLVGGEVEHLPGRVGRSAETASSGSSPLSWTTSGSTRADGSHRAGAATASAVIATTSGRRRRRSRLRASARAPRPRPARAPAACPATRLSPIASARRGIAARTPPSSVTPQILTNGRPRDVGRVVRGSAGRDERACGGGRVIAPDERFADQRGVEPERAPAARSSPGSRTPDSATTSRSSGTSSRRRRRAVEIDVERPQVAVVEPDDPRRGSRAPLELALVVDLDERLEPELERLLDQARQTPRGMENREQQDEVRTGGAEDRRAGPRRPRSPWPGPARRPRPAPRAGRRRSRRTSAARTAPRSRPRHRPRTRGRARRCPRRPRRSGRPMARRA